MMQLYAVMNSLISICLSGFLKKHIKYPKELQHLNASQLGFAILSLYSIFYGYRGVVFKMILLKIISLDF